MYRLFARPARSTRLRRVLPAVVLILCALITVPAAFALSNGIPAALVLGQPDFTTNTQATSATEMRAPTGIAVDPTTGKVFVASYNDHRVLRFASRASLTSGAAAEAVLGQVDFTSRQGGVAANKLAFPYSVAVDNAGRLWVTDYGNHRVLRFDDAANKATGAAADGVLGQSTFTTLTAATTSTGMRFPVGIAADSSGRVWVADQGNHRVLRFDNAASKANGAPADGVLGQASFTTNSVATSATGMNNPVNVGVDAAGRVWVADFSNNRVLRFDDAATKINGAAADGVLGQPNFTTPSAVISATGLNGPFGVAVDSNGRVWVSDYGSHRMLWFDGGATKANGAPADGVLGQTNFTSSARGTAASKLWNPWGVAAVGTSELWVVDFGNNRVLLFDLKSPIMSVSGKGQTISSGDTTPDTADGTDFGALTVGAAASETFTIANSASADKTLNLSGTPSISISGAAASDFTVTIDPASPIAIGASTTFVVRFSPSATGTRTATVSIASDDYTRNPYTFVVQGTGTQTPAFTSSTSPGGTFGTPYSYTFGANGFPAPTFSVSAGALPPGLTLDSTSGLLSGTPTGAGSYSFTVSASNSAGVNTRSITLLIAKATQSVSFGTLSGKTYGDAAFAVSATASSGLAVSFSSTTPAACTVSGVTVTIAGASTCTITADQAGSDNYGAASPVTQSFTVAKKALTATAKDKGRVYGSDNPTFDFTYSGFVAGEDENVLDLLPVASTAAVLSSNVGTYAITASDVSDNNYNVTTTDGTLTITKAALTITARDETRKVGTPNPTFVALYSGFVGNDNEGVLATPVVLSTNAGQNSATGTYDIVASGATAQNYTITLVNGTLTITSKDVPVLTWPQPQPIVYGTPLGAAQLNASVSVNNQPLQGTWSYIPATNTILGAGDGQVLDVTFTPEDTTNYATISTQTTLDVLKAQLVVTAENKNGVTGQGLPNFTYTVAGFVNNETTSVLSGAPICTSTATTASPAGQYDITCSLGTLVASNYHITFAKGTLTLVAPRATISKADVGIGGHINLRGTVEYATEVRLTLRPQAASSIQAMSDLVYTVSADTEGAWTLDTTTAIPDGASMPIDGFANGVQIAISVQPLSDGQTNGAVVTVEVNTGYRMLLPLVTATTSTLGPDDQR